MLISDAIRTLFDRPVACLVTVLVVSIVWYLGAHLVAKLP